MANPKKIKLHGWVLVLLVTMVLTSAGAAEPVKPSAGDKCPVCGMFVAKYPDWVAEIVFKDRSTVFFDGAKDLFKYYFNLNRYNPRKNKKDIATVYVTEYYYMTLIDAREAHYVIGSNVYGPMGRELIPFKSEPEAAEFLKDHRGQKVVGFKDVTPVLIESLD
ncbi:nitrous oxide reductase accessory protein NosL [Thermodesulfobacteriota bacterium]